MFDNIGGKIKSLAKVLTVLGIVISVIYGLVLMGSDEDLIFVGFLVMVLGSLLFWIASFTLYGFGEMINQLEYSNSNSKKIYDLLNNLTNIISHQNVLTNIISQQIEKPKEPQQVEPQKEPRKSEHKWLCNSCGKLRDKSPCPYCGNK